MTLTFAQLRAANVARLPLFRNRKGEPAHSKPDGSDWSPAQWLQAVAGELGEYANLRKKFERGDIDEAEFKAEAADELADVVTYLDLLAFQLRIDLGAATVSKWNRISERIGIDLRLTPGRPYTIQEIPGLSAPDGVHYRITDSSDSRVATCYLREHAVVVCDALNARAALGALLHDAAEALSWALDMVDMYDVRLAKIDGAELVYSNIHVRGKAKARGAEAALRNTALTTASEPSDREIADLLEKRARKAFMVEGMMGYSKRLADAAELLRDDAKPVGTVTVVEHRPLEDEI